MPEFPRITDHLIVLLLGCLLPFASGIRGRDAMKDMVFTEQVRRRFFVSNSLFLIASAGVVVLHWHWRGRPLEAMGFRASLKTGDAATMAVLSALMLLAYSAHLLLSLRNIAARTRMRRDIVERTPFLPRHARELPAYVLMCAAAGVCEETIYRGYMVTYFLPETNLRSGPPLLALLFPAVIFGLAHYYQGWEAVVKIMLMSLLLAGMFIAGGALWPVILVHFGIDLVGGLIAMPVLRKHDAGLPVSEGD